MGEGGMEWREGGGGRDKSKRGRNKAHHHLTTPASHQG